MDSSAAWRPHGNPQAILASLWLLIWLPLAALWRPWPPLTLIGQSLPALARAVTPLAALPRKSMPRRCLVRVRQLVRIGCRSGQERCQFETHRASAGKALATMDKIKVYKRSRRWKPRIFSSFAPPACPMAALYTPTAFLQRVA